MCPSYDHSQPCLNLSDFKDVVGDSSCQSYLCVLGCVVISADSVLPERVIQRNVSVAVVRGHMIITSVSFNEI